MKTLSLETHRANGSKQSAVEGAKDFASFRKPRSTRQVPSLLQGMGLLVTCITQGAALGWLASPRWGWILPVLGLLQFLPSAIAQLSSADSISFQGALTGPNGQPLSNGTYNLTFKLYSNATTLTALATSAVPNLSVMGGIVSTTIPVDVAWFSGQARYLGIAVNGGAELAPRVLVTAVPYALKSVTVGDQQGNFVAKTASLVACELNGPTARLRLGSSEGDSDAVIRLEHHLDPVAGWWVVDPGVSGPGNLGFLRREPAHLPYSYVEAKSFIMTTNGFFGIGTLYPLAKMDVRGIGRISALDVTGEGGGNVAGTLLNVQGRAKVAVLQITGGADLAEHLSVNDTQADDEFKVEPGMVVSIDSSGNRKFKLSDEPYDRKRVGIISGGHGVQPGLVLRDEGNTHADGEQPIALTGQVWCHADSAFGTITPGDLLTTSSTPGHAMKVTDDTRARFAVLGQALTGLKEGRGWVQVLVRCQ